MLALALALIAAVFLARPFEWCAGRRVEAVEQARAELGLGLAEAKQHVDRLARRIAGATTAPAPPR